MTLSSFQGASGRCYDYALLNHKTRAAFPMSGGNYLFAREAGGAVKVICAGETDSIWSVFVSTPLWEIAKNQHGATAAYIHLNPDRKARELENFDLVTKHQPPMNVAAAVDNES